MNVPAGGQRRASVSCRLLGGTSLKSPPEFVRVKGRFVVNQRDFEPVGDRFDLRPDLWVESISVPAMVVCRLAIAMISGVKPSRRGRLRIRAPLTSR